MQIVSNRPLRHRNGTGASILRVAVGLAALLMAFAALMRALVGPAVMAVLSPGPASAGELLTAICAVAGAVAAATMWVQVSIECLHLLRGLTRGLTSNPSMATPPSGRQRLARRLAVLLVGAGAFGVLGSGAAQATPPAPTSTASTATAPSTPTPTTTGWTAPAPQWTAPSQTAHPWSSPTGPTPRPEPTGSPTTTPSASPSAPPSATPSATPSTSPEPGAAGTSDQTTDGGGFTPAAPVVRPLPDPGFRPAADPTRATEAARAAGASADPATSTVVVLRGDTLWSLAAAHLGPGATDAEIARAWPHWFEANREVIGTDPDLLRPGQILAVPVIGGA